MDTLIRSADVVDGTGAPRRPADVLISGDRIAEIGPAGSADARGVSRVIDGRGLVVAPGFIDLHAHSDLQILANPRHEAKISQGVTTELLGQDGLSYAPVDEPTLEQLRVQLAGWNDDPDGFDFSWRSVAGYLDRLDRGIATNAAYLVPHGTVRAMVVGFDAEQASPEQLQRMEHLVAEAMDEGALGLSAGLTYVPGSYATAAELIALCRVVALRGGFFAPHHRSYGRGALEAYREMLSVARTAGCALHLTHATMNFAVNRGRAQELLDLVDDALDAGLDVTLDSYPYTAGSTTLAALLPSWALSGGSRAVQHRLQDPGQLARIRDELEVRGSDGCHGVPVDWDTVEISGVGTSELADAVGRTVAELARVGGRQAFEVFADLLRRDRAATGILQHVGDEANVRTVMRHRVHTGGSDGILVGAKPHPRGWGTFPRYLGHYGRELGLFGLEEIVHHVTGRAAARLRLDRRGLIRPGYAADLVIFDPLTVIDRATYAEPRQPAAGIRYVYVNGVAALDDGELTGARSGRALRRDQQTGLARPRPRA